MSKKITANIPAGAIDYLAPLMRRGGRIQIVSGEGEIGTVESYAGEPTVKAVAARLNAERGAGDRWAYALIESLDPGMVDGHAVRWDGAGMLCDGAINVANDDA